MEKAINLIARAVVAALVDRPILPLIIDDIDGGRPSPQSPLTEIVIVGDFRELRIDLVPVNR